MNLCRYRNFFGVPGVGLHSFRIFNLAIVDVVFTLVGAYLISVNTKYTFLISSIGLISLGIFFHYVFCVETTISKTIAKLYKK